MADLRAIGEVTGDEYSMFTQNGNRLIIRGNGRTVSVSSEMYDDLLAGTYGRFSGHTHPPGYSIMPGPKDRPFLSAMNQRACAIWGDGGHYVFSRTGVVEDSIIQSEIMRKMWMKNYER